MRARGSRAAVTPIDVALTVTTTLPPAARVALIAEVDAIWRDAGVVVRWLDAADADSPAALRVFVVDRQMTPAGGTQWVAGELLREPGRGAIARASIARAEAIVAAAGAGPSRPTPPALTHHRLGVVLGRALAHEIGHYLLGTAEHAPHGLMRATIPPREFTDLRSGAFVIDKASQERIRARRAAMRPRTTG